MHQNSEINRIKNILAVLKRIKIQKDRNLQKKSRNISKKHMCNISKNT